MLTIRIMRAIILLRGEKMTFKELEKLLLNDGWSFKGAKGSHYQYIHPNKKGKITIPRHGGDINIKTAKTILKQAGIE